TEVGKMCPKPPVALSGIAWARHFQTASEMASAGTIVASAVVPGHSTFVIVPLGAETVTCRVQPWLCGMSGSRQQRIGVLAAFWHVAHEALTPPRACGSEPLKSMWMSVPEIVNVQRTAISVCPVPSESTQASAE